MDDRSHAPQVRLINGQIVLDTDSLVVDRANEHTVVDTSAMEVVEETNMTRKLNSQTWGKKSHSARWTPYETMDFYNVSICVTYLHPYSLYLFRQLHNSGLISLWWLTYFLVELATKYVTSSIERRRNILKGSRKCYIGKGFPWVSDHSMSWPLCFWLIF